KAALLTVHFQPNGLGIRGHVQIAADSKTDGLLRDFKPAALGELARLPEGQMFYTAMEMSPAMLTSFGPLMYGVAHDPDSKEGKAVKDALDQLAAAKPKARYDAANIPVQGLSVWFYEDPVKAAAPHLKLLQALQGGDQFSSGVIKDKPVIKA